MGICVFKTAEIKRCLQHALAAPDWNMGYDNEAARVPALQFVHDQGVYMMSNGIPKDTVDNSGSYVVYAEGCDPAKAEFDDWYGKSKDLVGGGDFVETLEITPDMVDMCDRFDNLELWVMPTEFAIKFTKSAKPRRKASRS